MKKAAELRQRVEAVGNRVNLLVFRCLTCPAHREDYTDAFDGLCACCWLAKRNMHIGGNVAETRVFIDKELSRLLRKYRRLGREEIERRALAGEFRHAARIVRNRMRDQIRKTYRELRAREKPEPSPPSLEPTRQEMQLAAAHVSGHKELFREALGWRNYVTLWIAAHIWPLARTRRERKSQIVSAIAARREVSPQQARADKRDLLRAVEESANPDVIALRSAGWFRWAFGLASA